MGNSFEKVKKAAFQPVVTGLPPDKGLSDAVDQMGSQGLSAQTSA
jgi:hypothetical protein